ncbi:hypothetical protein H7R52_07295 [Weissella confusa]|uniref:Carbamoyl-phosphate synthetase large subunit oligomerisation domain-containing protein n=1 Tax=Weissella confusa TaxID=1583 RepID=A0A923NF16_WEICO|nr:hypothetical protein [Weissella confusa]
MNNNPTDLTFIPQLAHKQYYEPLEISDVMNVIEIEQPTRVFVPGNRIKLITSLRKMGVNVQVSFEPSAGEFEESVSQFYSTFETENESERLGDDSALVIGTGAFRLGDGAAASYTMAMVADELSRQGIHAFYFYKLERINNLESAVKDHPWDTDTLQQAKYYGLSDGLVAKLWDEKYEAVRRYRWDNGILPTYKFEEALEKAIRAAHFNNRNFSPTVMNALTDNEIIEQLIHPRDNRILVLLEAIRRGYTVDELAELTKIRETLDKVRVPSIYAEHTALLEPTMDHIVIRFPVFAFGELESAGIQTENRLDTVQKSVGATIGVGRSQQLRNAAFTVARGFNVVGLLEVRFAVNPTTEEYVITRLTPYFDRTSAMLVAATGYPLVPVIAGLMMVNRSLTHQVNVDKSIRGDQEIAMVVVRDKRDTTLLIGGVEDMDPVGIHSADSIAITPVQTLPDPVFKYLQERLTKLKLPAIQTRLASNVSEVFDAAREFDLPVVVRSVAPVGQTIRLQVEDVEELEGAAETALTVIETELTAPNLVKVIVEQGITAMVASVGGSTAVRLSAEIVELLGDSAPKVLGMTLPVMQATQNTHGDCTSRRVAIMSERILIIGGSANDFGRETESDAASYQVVKGLRRRGHEIVIVDDNPFGFTTERDDCDAGARLQC